jgi:hypothetical protein
MDFEVSQKVEKRGFLIHNLSRSFPEQKWGKLGQVNS